MAKGINKNWVLYIGFTIFLVCLFGLKDVLILASDKWPHIYSVVNAPRSSWEETYCYFPLANQFSLTNPLPAAPMVEPGLSKFAFFPAITLVTQGVFFKWICLSNIDLYFFLMHTIFPVLSFWLIFLVFRRYIDISWSLILAFCGSATFPNFALIPYLINLVTTPSGFVTAASLSPMELTRTPVPSFTFFFFILTFYISTKESRPSKGRYLLMSVMWALNLYVYLFNFVAGILFWCLYIVYTRYLKDRGVNIRSIILTLSKNLLVVLVVISPIIVKRLFYFDSVDKEIFQRMELVSATAGFIVNDWGWVISYLLPLAVTITVIWIFCADYYELMYRFTPVFILILVEIVVSNIHLVSGKFFQPQLFTLRIADYFLRYLYFMPIIYFLSQPHKKLFHNNLKNRISGLLHGFFQRYVVKLRVLIASAGIFTISLFIVFSSLRYSAHHESVIAPRMEAVKRNYDELISFAEGRGGMIVSEDIPVNLLIPVVSKRETILVNGFCNYTSGDEILNRLVLFAHIFDWDKQQFLDFMMPSDEFERSNTDNDFVLSDSILQKGFGYWLLNHRRQMDAKDIHEYSETILNTYEKFDLQENIKKYRVGVVQTAGAVNSLLPIESVRQGPNNKVYLIKEL